MSFYNDEWIIANMGKEEIFLLRKSTNDILLDRIRKDTNMSIKESIVRDMLDEYDVDIDAKGKVYVIYQDKDMNLSITVLDGEKKEDIRLTSEPIPEVIDLNIIISDNKIHIVYLIKIEDEENRYRIYHNYYDGSDWKVFIVEEIIAKEVLNPIKLIRGENNLILGYYVNNMEIQVKEFNLRRLTWSDEFKLVDDPNEKLYLDIIEDKGNIHLAYCEFQEGELVIQYKKFNRSRQGYEVESENIISNKGSPSHPTIIIYENKTWINWVESDKIMSRVSDDYGIGWSDYIYAWNKSRSIDFVRYKYLSMYLEKDRILDYAFGSVYPEIEFIGFGPLENTKEIPIKKNPIKGSEI